MIPKVIHYCWFGRNPKPKEVLDYIETWKKFLPDFEIKEWNEDNFDVNMMPYTKEAYYAKKYAFVSDVARLYALVHEGGIYFDTDIRVVKRFSDELLNSHGFLGFEHDEYVTTGVMAVEAHNTLFKAILNKYAKRSFFCGYYKYDVKTNVKYVTDYLKKIGLVCNNQHQMFKGLIFLPQIYLCANDWYTKSKYNTSETYTIHEFNYSWKSSGKLKMYILQFLVILKYRLFNFYKK